MFIIVITIMINISIIVSFKIIYKVNLNQILNKYDLNMRETVAIYEMEKENYIYIILAIVFTDILAITYILLNCFIKRREKKKLEKIRLNLIDINNKNYPSFIKEMEEGEFGTFQNDIYQTVIRLQEYAEKINTDKVKLSSYLSDISHQLRTPLLAISVLIDNLLQMETENNKKNNKIIFKISTQLDKMKWLVDNLLKMAQLDTKTITFKSEKIYVEKLIKEVIKNVEILLELSQIEVIIQGEKNVNFFGDSKWNIEAITNIVKNAIEHSKRKNKIYIKYRENILYAEIVIEDKRKWNFTKRFISHI